MEVNGTGGANATMDAILAHYGAVEGPASMTVEEGVVRCENGEVSAETVRTMLAIAGTHEVEYLAFSKVSLDEEALIELEKGLRDAGSVLSLIVADCMLSPELLARLIEGVGASDLVGLELVGMVMERGSLESLNRVLAVNTTLTHLTLQDATLGDDEVRLLADGLLDNESLRCLCLAQNTIGRVHEEGVKDLAEAIKEHPKLDSLSLESNSLNDDSLRYLAQLLEIPGFECLSLEDNPDITDRGAEYLRESLKAISHSMAVDGEELELCLGHTSITPTKVGELQSSLGMAQVCISYQANDEEMDTEDTSGFVDWNVEKVTPSAAAEPSSRVYEGGSSDEDYDYSDDSSQSDYSDIESD